MKGCLFVVAALTLLCAVQCASPSGESMPVGDVVSGGFLWKSIFAEDFNTNAALGTFDTVYKDKFGSYGPGWKDTSKHGTYDTPRVVSVSGGLLDKYLHSENGVHYVANLTPKITGYGQLYGRYSARMRSDVIKNYKVAWLLWPDSDVWPQDGEVDYPEGNLNGGANGFMHYANPACSKDCGQDVISTKNSKFIDWHTYTMEWSPGKIVFYLDGAVVGTSTTKIPAGKMHYMLQTETALGPAPNNTDQGHLKCDWVALWSYGGAAPSTTKPPTTTTKAPTTTTTTTKAATTKAPTTKAATTKAATTKAATTKAATTKAPATTSKPVPLPKGDIIKDGIKWTQVFYDDFTTNCARGSFPTTYTNWGNYGPDWKDSGKNGMYNSLKTVSVSNGLLDIWLHNEGGVNYAAVLNPKSKLWNGKYGRVSHRVRSDSASKYKTQFLLWPNSGSWPTDGSISYPNGALDGAPAGYAFQANPTQSSTYIATNAKWGDWHVYTFEWSPGKIVFYLDGAVIGTSTTKVPSVAMHMLIQSETSGVPASTTSGHLQIDWLTIYSYSPVTGESGNGTDIFESSSDVSSNSTETSSSEVPSGPGEDYEYGSHSTSASESGSGSESQAESVSGSASASTETSDSAASGTSAEPTETPEPTDEPTEEPTETPAPTDAQPTETPAPTTQPAGTQAGTTGAISDVADLIASATTVQCATALILAVILAVL